MPKKGLTRDLIIDTVVEDPSTLQEGDIITAVNGSPASATSDILTVKNTLSVGDTITFTIWRDGETFDVDVTLVDENDLK